MIRLSNVEKADSGQIYITVLMDAKAAGILDRKMKGEVERNIDKRLVALSNSINLKRNTDLLEQEFREYLKENLFKHYFDPIAINDFVYDSREVFKRYRESIILVGFQIVHVYINDTSKG